MGQTNQFLRCLGRCGPVILSQPIFERTFYTYDNKRECFHSIASVCTPVSIRRGFLAKFSQNKGPFLSQRCWLFWLSPSNSFCGALNERLTKLDKNIKQHKVNDNIRKLQANAISATWRGNFNCRKPTDFQIRKSCTLKKNIPATRQVLYHFVAGKRRNQPASEISTYSKRNGGKTA